jgi:anion-transporting  ArsA/GET3 family ATPase
VSAVISLANHEVVICCGTGGVGKTTTAAAVALDAARHGRRAVVVTIDPAKRLADTLGLAALSDTPSEIDPALWRRPGDDPRGSLDALMLDSKSTFDRLVTRYANDEEQAQRILDNGFYRNVSGALGGTQEYMAAEKLHELHEEGRFDIIVVDTPPTRHALDFLDAPARLLRLLDNRVFRLLMMPTRAYLRVASVAVQTFLRTVARVVGSAVIDDVVSFFQAFEGMEAGFRERAAHVQALIADPSTAFVLVTSARRDAVAETEFFAQRLAETQLAVTALIVNRVHPEFGDELPEGLRARAHAFPAEARLAALYDNLADYREVAQRERAAVHDISERVGGNVPTVFVPLLDHDVHDFASLGEVAADLHLAFWPPFERDVVHDR